MRGMFGIRIMSGNQLLNGYANGITPNYGVSFIGCEIDGDYYIGWGYEQ